MFGEFFENIVRITFIIRLNRIDKLRFFHLHYNPPTLFKLHTWRKVEIQCCKRGTSAFPVSREFSLWSNAGYSLCITNRSQRWKSWSWPDGAFQEKRSLRKMGWLVRRMGLRAHSHTDCHIPNTLIVTCVWWGNRVYRYYGTLPRLKRGWFVDHPNRDGGRRSPYLTFHRSSHRWLWNKSIVCVKVS